MDGVRTDISKETSHPLMSILAPTLGGLISVNPRGDATTTMGLLGASIARCSGYVSRRSRRCEVWPDAAAVTAARRDRGPMLRELRPEAPMRPVRLDDRIDRDLGLDSLSRVELVLRIEHAFGVHLPERLATAARTPRDLLDAIAKRSR